MRGVWLRFGGGSALALASLLAVVVVAGWCLGTGVRTWSDLRVPTAYVDLEKSDVIDQLAHIRAARDGHFVPVGSKRIPQLGAPQVADWSDWPLVEEVPFMVLGWLAQASDLFTALNLGLLGGHLLAALTFFGVARLLGAGLSWAFLGGVAFGLAPYLFAQSPHHTGAQLCWHVPLFIPVWQWIADTNGIAPWSRRFWFSVGVAAVTGLHSVYFTLVFCQLVLLGALVGYWRNRRLGPLLSAGACLAAAAASFALMTLDTWVHRWTHGPNPAALVRSYHWLEIYGLKAVDLVAPPRDYWNTPLATWAAEHWRGGVLIDEGSYLGLLGVTGLLALAFVALRALRRRDLTQVPLEAWQTAWIFAFFSTGGLNLVLGLAGFQLFRANCRLSIVLLAVVLMYVVRGLSAWSLRAGPATSRLALLLALLVAMEQVPRAPDAAARAAIAAQIGSDRDFGAALEAALGPRAMVLQLPILPYPETPLPGMSTYDHLRPYLHSVDLRFSYGSVKGRTDSDWQAALGRKPMPELIQSARAAGFRAIYLNRTAFRDRAEPLLEELRRRGYRTRIESRLGDLIAVPLQ